MTQEIWDTVDDYFTTTLLADDRTDGALAAATEATRAGGLPEIAVSATQGAQLAVLALAVGARRILEVGTLGGYSAIWMARTLPPDGRIVTLELDPHHAEVARANLRRAGVADQVDVRVGPALETLPGVAADGLGPFDLAFIDADKVNNAHYFAWAVRLCRPGALIVVDNVVRGGRVVDADTDDPSAIGTRRVLEAMAAEPRVRATAIQTVGAKGWDGFAIAVVLP